MFSKDETCEKKKKIKIIGFLFPSGSGSNMLKG